MYTPINIQAERMQGRPLARSNRERSDTTQDSLVSAARALFVEKGYAATSTPEIAAAADITRGALYHHFADKRDLFRAVVDREARAVAEAIEAIDPSLSGREALMAGTDAYLDAMTVKGRTRLLLVEGPVVLGGSELSALDEVHGARTLREGLEGAIAESGDIGLSVAVLANLLAAMFDRAAITIEAGGDAEVFRSTMLAVIERVLRS